MEPSRRIVPTHPADLAEREWLVTNGLGGYASGTVLGPPTRRYHGLLIAALALPFGRMMMLNRLVETVHLPDGTSFRLEGEDDALGALAEFQLDAGLPVWIFRSHGVTVEKRVVMPHLQNTTNVYYRLLGGDGPVTIDIRPWMHFRDHDAQVDRALPTPQVVSVLAGRTEIRMGDLPKLRLAMRNTGPRLVLDGDQYCETYYRAEAERGYDSLGPLWSPGLFSAPLTEFGPVLLASTEAWHTVMALAPDDALAYERERRRRLLALAHPELQTGVAAELVLAADAFIVTPRTRVADSMRARSHGDDICTIFAGYHWFTDWGRDTMISLEGLTLVTGRSVEAAWVLRNFAHYVRDGLIPNMFPEHGAEGLYHTADATLWFFHALDRYLATTGDKTTLALILPVLKDIVEKHRLGTRFNIGVDPADGLLREGQDGYQLTWMDAKVGDWVVTPRRGKPVEINALWYNALKLMAGWLAESGDDDGAAQAEDDADRVHQSFNQRFWCDRVGHLYDVVDGEGGDDCCCRPNQILAVALHHPVLEPGRWAAVVDIVAERLLTPVGLRSLAPGDAEYKPRYFGNLRSRDAAYHQGTVWAWLIGPFIDAWLKVYPDDPRAARRFLEGLMPEVQQAGLGTLSEIFDAEPPYTPRGCIAQAWSVAEWLRTWVLTAGA
jgi:predicted glycogen debranching enzyme